MKQFSLPLSGEERFLRAARSEATDRPPVWIMRQAGRYLPEYMTLCERYSFKQRCEIPELAIRISLQPFLRFRPDGVIMFSDILTPLEGMGIPFELVESVGPIIHSPIRTQSQIDDIQLLEPEQSLPFIREILRGIRSAVGSFAKTPQRADAAVLGFVGAPWTLATYLVEGRSSQNYATIKEMNGADLRLLSSGGELLFQNSARLVHQRKSFGPSLSFSGLMSVRAEWDGGLSDHL